MKSIIFSSMSLAYKPSGLIPGISPCAFMQGGLICLPDLENLEFERVTLKTSNLLDFWANDLE